MTVESRAQRVMYRGNGTAVSFPFGFTVYGEEQVRVVTADAAGRETERTLGTDYTVILAEAGTGEGGSVTYPLTGPPLAEGEKLVILSAVPSTQDKSFPNNTPYYQEDIEGGMDKAVRLVQQLEESLSRAVLVPVSSGRTPGELMAALFEAEAEAAASAEAAARSEEKAAESARLAVDTVVGIEAVGEAETARVRSEGAYQYERVLVEGKAQRREQQKLAKDSLDAIVQAGEHYLLAIVGEGRTQIAAVAGQGATERERLISEALAQIALVKNEGDFQAGRVKPLLDAAEGVIAAARALAEQHGAVLARVARAEARMARMEEEIVTLRGLHIGDSGGGGSGTGGGGDPAWSEGGAYTGPVAVGTSLLDLGDAGILFLVDDGARTDGDDETGGQ